MLILFFLAFLSLFGILFIVEMQHQIKHFEILLL